MSLHGYCFGSMHYSRCKQDPQRRGNVLGGNNETPETLINLLPRSVVYQNNSRGGVRSSGGNKSLNGTCWGRWVVLLINKTTSWQKCSRPEKQTELIKSKGVASFSKSTWGEQPVEYIPNFTCICVYLFIYVCVFIYLCHVSWPNDKRFRPEIWYTYSHRLYLKTGFLFFRKKSPWRPLA